MVAQTIDPKLIIKSKRIFTISFVVSIISQIISNCTWVKIRRQIINAINNNKVRDFDYFLIDKFASFHWKYMFLGQSINHIWQKYLLFNKENNILHDVNFYCFFHCSKLFILDIIEWAHAENDTKNSSKQKSSKKSLDSMHNKKFIAFLIHNLKLVTEMFFIISK